MLAHTCPRCWWPRGSLSTAGTEQQPQGALELAANSVKARARLRWLLRMWDPAGNFCDQKCKDLYRSAQAKWKNLLNASQVPRYPLGSTEEDKEMPIMLSCQTYSDSRGLLSGWHRELVTLLS